MSVASITVRRLTHRFGTGAVSRLALRDVSLDAIAGEIVLVTGRSGSGKSSLFSILGGLRRVQQGEVTVLDTRLDQLDDGGLDRFRSRVRFVFQHFHLLDSLTALENVVVGLSHRTPRRAAAVSAQAMLDRVGLHGRGGAARHELSGGEQQRVAIARALVSQPSLLLADEPTAALDATTGATVTDLIRALAKEANCTVLIATHDERMLRIADRHFVIDDGTVAVAKLGA